MNNQPATEANRILDRLRALEGQPDEFTLKLLENNAIKLKQVDPSQAYMILGIIGAYRKDFEFCDSNFKKSLKIQKDDVVLINYATSLAKLGYCSLGYDQALIALDMVDNDIYNYRETLKISYNSGHYSKIVEISDKLKKLQIETTDEENIMVNISKKILDYNLSDNFTSSVMALAEKVSREYKQDFNKLKYELDPPGFPVTCALEVNGSAETIVDMNIRLCDLFAENNIPIGQFDKFCVMFTSEN